MQYKINHLLRTAVLFFVLGLFAHQSTASVEQSVVKIVNQYNQFDWYAPWESGATGKGTGSGFVIDKKRIMTNAHVVSDSSLLLVYFHNDPTPYPAHVASIGHDCDLAILELNDPSRIEHIPPLEFDGLPALRSHVFTYGYPAGGRMISSTAGVVSRIEAQNYAHSGVQQLLTVQTDAAINPGNSGGPVIQNDKVVGVAFQGTMELENTGFFIPGVIINHFLTDMKDGSYDGFPDLGAFTANMENPAARAYAQMKPGETGVRVEFISKGTGSEGLLQPDDVITSIEGYDLANDGTIEWNGLRLYGLFPIDCLQKGDTATIKLIRNGDRMEIKIPLNDYSPSQAIGNIYDQRPTYYIYAGLVFAPVNRETLKTFSKNWFSDAPQELIYEFYYRSILKNERYDIPKIMQIRRLDDTVNVEESRYLYRLIETVNDIPVNTLQELAEAFENNTKPYHTIRYAYGNRITVLDRQKADAAHEEILHKYAIPKDRNL